LYKFLRPSINSVEDGIEACECAILLALIAHGKWHYLVPGT